VVGKGEGEDDDEGFKISASSLLRSQLSCAILTQDHSDWTPNEQYAIQQKSKVFDYHMDESIDGRTMKY
jgi:hypothetical protein